ncbi:MAG TPA: LptA/OstA family protein [Vicinamibacteria bacterium]|nr:LptA/OstA family protein [Vicinamibacteria bacterium]
MRLTPRFVRGGLLILLALVSGAVALSLRHAGAPSGSATAGRGAPTGTTLDQMVLVQFGEGEARRTVKAQHVAGSDGAAQLLEGVEATLPYLEEGKPGTLTIRADRCRYTPQPLRAEFRGHVEVRSSTGLELDSEALDYRSSPEEGSTDEFVRFKRGNLSGTARGASFRRQSGVELNSEVKLLVTSAAALPTTIEAGQAQVARAEGRVYFDGGVHVVQGSRDLRCDKLQLTMVDDFKTLQRAVALDEVDLHAGAGAGVGSLGPGGGERRLRCRKLVVKLLEGGHPQEATAHNRAVLEIFPAVASGETRRVATNFIRFVFDEQGRITGMDARADEDRDAEAQRVTVATSVSPTVQRRLECLQLHVALDPESGAVQGAEVVQNLVYAEPGRKAWAQHALFQDGPGLLTLTGAPRLVDEEQGSDLRAQKIELQTRTHGITADENVRHTITRKAGKDGKAGAGPGPLGSGDEPTVVLCRHFEYDSATKTARYGENALMRSGRDEIRAPLLVLEEPAEGRRRLTASDGVVSLLHPRAEKGQKKEPAAVETRSKQMVYDEQQRRVVYTGDVEIRQGDLLTRSPEAVVLLTPDGGTVDRMLAGTPVEVRQGDRQATGERGTYTPRDETLVLVGEKVVLQEIDRRLEGRILTFQSGSDRIRVDGREEVRSEAVLKRREPPKP